MSKNDLTLFFVWCWFELLKKRTAKAKYDAQYTKENWKRIQSRRKQYREANEDRLRQSRAAFRELHGDRVNLERRLAYKQNSAAILARNRKWREANSEKSARISREWVAKNRDRVRDNIRAWKQRNKERWTRWLREWNRKRLTSNPNARIRTNLASRIYMALRAKASKSARTEALLGCSVAQLKAHLEKLFRPGMTWDNYGEWHIDHIRPCASFDLTDPEQQKACFNFANLQPLWAKENLSKGAKLDAA